MVNWFRGKESAYQCWGYGFDSWFRKIPQTRKWQPTPLFLRGKSHGQRFLVDYSPWGCKSVVCNLVSKQKQQIKRWLDHLAGHIYIYIYIYIYCFSFWGLFFSLKKNLQYYLWEGLYLTFCFADFYLPVMINRTPPNSSSSGPHISNHWDFSGSTSPENKLSGYSKHEEWGNFLFLLQMVEVSTKKLCTSLTDFQANLTLSSSPVHASFFPIPIPLAIFWLANQLDCVASAFIQPSSSPGRDFDSLEKTLMLGRIGQEEKAITEDEMVGWHHLLNGHGFG